MVSFGYFNDGMEKGYVIYILYVNGTFYVINKKPQTTLLGQNLKRNPNSYCIS